MVAKRDKHEEPVIRALVSLRGETHVEVTERCLPCSGLFVYPLPGLLARYFLFMKAKILILSLLLVPFVSGAETIEYIKTDKETIDDVRVKIAEQYAVDPDSLWIWDLENDPNKLFIDLPAKQETETDSDTKDDGSEPTKQASLEVEKENENEKVIQVIQDDSKELKEKVEQLHQLIKLLLQLIALKQGQI